MPEIPKIDASPNLYEASDQSSIRIVLISGDWGVRRSFNQLGIHAGDCVQVICHAPFGGPLVIKNRGAQVAIGKQLAEHVRVELLS